MTDHPNPFVGRAQRLILQREDGKFFSAGGDYPDTWVTDPLCATNRANYVDLRDVLLGRTDCDVVEVEVLARLTGRTTADLFWDHSLLVDELPDPLQTRSLEELAFDLEALRQSKKSEQKAYEILLAEVKENLAAMTKERDELRWKVRARSLTDDQIYDDLDAMNEVIRNRDNDGGRQPEWAYERISELDHEQTRRALEKQLTEHNRNAPKIKEDT